MSKEKKQAKLVRRLGKRLLEADSHLVRIQNELREHIRAGGTLEAAREALTKAGLPAGVNLELLLNAKTPVERIAAAGLLSDPE